jgi:hypothetical protein
LPKGIGLESINRTISAPSARVCRSAFFAMVATSFETLAYASSSG